MRIEKEKETFKFLRGGGEMGALIREKDWASTPLGEPEQWPSALKILLNTLLSSRYPKFLFWGRDQLCFYNDAYRPSLGKEGKHPHILGMPAREAWTEIWEIIGPQIDQVMNGGEATWFEDQLVPIYRNGKIEDVYWTYSYSPAFDAHGDIQGVLVTCTETTKKVRSLAKLRENQQQLQLAMEAANMGTWEWHPLTGEYVVDALVAQWIGRPATGRARISDEDAFDPIHPDDRARVTRAVEKALDPASDGSYDCTYSLQLTDQPNRVVRVLGKAWFNEEKEVYRFNGVMMDVTNSHAAGQERLMLSGLVDLSNEFIGFADHEMNIQFINKAGLDLLGWETVEGKKIMDAIYPEDLEVAKEALLNIGDRDHDTREIRFLDRRTGKPVWMKWNVIIIREPETRKIINYGTVSTNLEVQRKRELELKNALAEIQEQEKRFRNLVKQAPVGIGIFEGEDFIVELANEAALRIVDRTEAQALGKPFFDILPETKEALEPLMNEVLMTGESNRGTNFPVILDRYGRRDTSYFNFIFYPMRDKQGGVRGVICVTTEVTESVLLSNKLKESAKQFKNLVIQSPIPMCILRGRDFVIEMANDILLEKIWRVRKDDVLGKPLTQIFPKLEDQRYPNLLNKILDQGEPLTVKESFAQIEGSDGMQEFYLDYDYAPLKELDGSVSGIMVTVNDVTDKVKARKKLEAFSRELEEQVSERTELLKKANLQLQDSIKELEQTNEELQSFAYISSHDLQEPLRKIQMFSSRIRDRDDGRMDEKDLRDFERISVAASRMRTLIDDLLAFSKTSTSPTDYEMTDLNEVFGEVLADLDEKIEAHQAQIEADELCTIRGIPFQLNQLFANLIENSIKFSKDDKAPRIRIRCREVAWDQTTRKVLLEPGKNYHEISIEDNGIGFEPYYGERIFQVFQRLHAKKQFEGTGIGLAIVKKIVQNHDGAITATGKPGEGATFTMYFPKP